MHIIEKALIPAAPERLWHLLTDPEAIKSWTPNIESIESSSAHETKPGVKSVMKIRERGELVEYASEIVEVDELRKLTLKLSGGSLGKNPMTVRYELSEESSGTSLAYSADWKPSSFLVLLAPLITWASKRHARGQMKSIQEAARTIAD